VSWDPRKFELCPFLCYRGILLTSTFLELKKPITLLNVYGPCLDKKSFWKKVAARGLLAHKNLILAGELNFTYDVGEVWGDSTHLDLLTGFFKDLFNENRPVDIALDVLVSNWRNGRGGSDSISKILIVYFLLKISYWELVYSNHGWNIPSFWTMHLSF